MLQTCGARYPVRSSRPPRPSPQSLHDRNSCPWNYRDEVRTATGSCQQPLWKRLRGLRCRRSRRSRSTCSAEPMAMIMAPTRIRRSGSGLNVQLPPGFSTAEDEGAAQLADRRLAQGHAGERGALRRPVDLLDAELDQSSVEDEIDELVEARLSGESSEAVGADQLRERHDRLPARRSFSSASSSVARAMTGRSRRRCFGGEHDHEVVVVVADAGDQRPGAVDAGGGERFVAGGVALDDEGPLLDRRRRRRRGSASTTTTGTFSSLRACQVLRPTRPKPQTMTWSCRGRSISRDMRRRLTSPPEKALESELERGGGSVESGAHPDRR